MAHNRFTQYFVDSFQELGKVTWPTKNRAVNICILVVIFVAISVGVIAGIDFLFNRGYAALRAFADSLNNSL